MQVLKYIRRFTTTVLLSATLLATGGCAAIAEGFFNAMVDSALGSSDGEYCHSDDRPPQRDESLRDVMTKNAR